MIQQYGFQVPRSGLAVTADEAVSIASEIGFPVALKVVSPDILHKTDVGGVALNQGSAEEVRQAYEYIMTSVQAACPQDAIEGIEIQEMVTGGTEIIIGLLDDPQFGPVIMFGLGGVFTEILHDVTFRVLPMEREDAAQMVREIQGYAMLQGYRGQPPVSEEMVIDLLMHANRLGTDYAGKLESVDLNPIVVWEDQHRVLDAKIIWHAQEREITVAPAPNPRHIATFFKAKSVAVVGASANPRKIGNSVMDSMLNYGYQGKVYPVNPKGNMIMGMTAYRSLEDITEPVELVIVTIGLDQVPGLIMQCAAKGIHNMIVISGGGKELGNETASLETEIRRLAREKDVRVIGPNCLGVFDGRTRLDTIFLMHDRVLRPGPGRVSILTQSGTVGLTFLEDAANMGLSKFVSYGNRADVDEADLMAYMADDPETDVIALYLEGLEDGREFLNVARQVSKMKPIVVFKAGRTERAARASMSHTGFFGGSHSMVQGAFKQANLIEVDSYEELRATCRIAAMQPPARGRRVGMISNGGGVLVQGIDLLNAYGLDIPPLSPESRHRLEAAYPSFYLAHNPIDLTGSATCADYEVGVEILMEDPNIDIVMAWFVFQTPLLAEDVVQRLVRLNNKYDKPMILGAVGGPYTVSRILAIVGEGIPVFRSVQEWATAARGAARLGELGY